MKQYSIAEASDAFTGIVRSVELGGPVEFTRRCLPVAVLLSAAEYVNDLTLVTFNRRDYARFADLIVVDWSNV